MSKITLRPFVNFHGRARDAVAFYRSVLGADLADLIVGVDGHPDYPPTVGDNMALAVGGTDKARLSKIFNGLAEGGKIKMPLAKQSSGGEVGWLVDRFGINWTVTVDKA